MNCVIAHVEAHADMPEGQRYAHPDRTWNPCATNAGALLSEHSAAASRAARSVGRAGLCGRVSEVNACAMHY